MIEVKNLSVIGHRWRHFLIPMILTASVGIKHTKREDVVEVRRSQVIVKLSWFFQRNPRRKGMNFAKIPWTVLLWQADDQRQLRQELDGDEEGSDAWFWSKMVNLRQLKNYLMTWKNM